MRNLKRILLVCFLLSISYFSFAQGSGITYSPNGLFDTVFDKDGRKYKLEDIAVKRTSSNFTTDLLCTSGYFHVYFEAGSGMEGSTTEQMARRNVICQVLTDISNFIPAPSGTPLANGNTYVNIWVKNITMLTNNIQALGVASSFFAVPSGSPSVGGIADNEVYKTITSGYDSYTSVASPVVVVNSPYSSATFYHGITAFNFNNPTINWETNLSATSTSLYDLYTVALHEITHALGIGSLIKYDGTSGFGNGFPYYSRYDKFLTTVNGTPLIVSPSACSLYNNTYYGGGTSVLHPGCNVNPPTSTGSSNNTDCLTALKYTGSVTIPLYTPACYEPGSSISHFEDMCVPPGGPANNDAYFAMSNAQNSGVFKRYLKPEERKVLCDLGYRVNGTYGSTSAYNSFNDYGTGQCAGTPVAGINDGISSTGNFVYVATAGGAAKTFTGILNNDRGAASYECLQVVSGPGSVTPSVGTTSFNFTPTATAGITLLRYIPVAIGGEKGNITYIYVYTNSTTNSCTVNACNLVPNGGFEELASGATYPNAQGQIENSCGWLPASYRTSPDYFHKLSPNPQVQIPCNFRGEQSTLSQAYAGFACGDNYGLENIFTRLSSPLQPNTNYRVTLDASLAEQYSANSSPLQIYLQKDFIQVTGIMNSVSDPSMLFTVPNITDFNIWTPVTINFNSGPGGQNCIIIGNINKPLTNQTPAPNPDPSVCTTYTVAPQTNATYLYVDNIVLQPASQAVDFTPPSSACVNQTIILNNYVTTIGGTFSGDGVSCSSGICSFTAANAGVGPHTITYTYTNSIGCIMTAAAVINVAGNINITATASPATICAGQSSTLTASGASSYVWQPGGSTQNPLLVTPASTTNYTVTGTNSSGCSNTANVTVTVYPLPVVSVSPSSATIVSGSSVTLTASGATTYTWTPSISCTNSSCSIVNASPTTTTTYTVTGTNSNGCSSTTTVTVTVIQSPPCTPAPAQGGYIPAITTITIPPSGFTLTTGTYTNINFAVNGDITISGRVILSGCDMRMSSMVKIIIPPGNTLTITNSPTTPVSPTTIDQKIGRQTHIYACNNMWDGIFVSTTGTTIGSLVIKGTSTINDEIPILIEDAEHAVVSVAGGRFIIQNAVFNKNYIGIEVKPYSNAPHNGTIVNTQFSCSVDATVSGTNAFLNAPHTGQRSNTGIQITEVINTILGFAGINVGSTALNSYPTTNTFVNLDYGILAYKSVVYAKNNLFLRCGTGISSSRGIGRGEPYAPNALFAGEANNPVAANIIKDCNYGITTGGENIHIYNNNISNSGASAISLVATSDLNNIDVRNNVINRAPTGIYGEFAVCAGPTGPTLPVLINVNINRNNITEVNKGILTTRINDITIGNNTVDVIPDVNGFAYGIILERGGGNTTVSNNKVTGTSAVDIKQFGIVAQSSPDAQIYQNLIKTVGNALYAYSYMPNATFTCNSMKDYTNGVVMENIPLGGFGPVGAADAASDNIWLNDPNGTGGHTYCINTDGSQIEWYIQNRLGGYIPAINNKSGLFSQALTPIIASAAPLSCNAPCTSPKQCRFSKYNAIVRNQINYPVQQELNRYDAVSYLFKTLLADTSLMHLGDADDAVYKAFYDSVAATNINTFMQAEKKTILGNIAAAQNIISQIIPVNIFEVNEKTVTSIYLRTLAQNIPMTAADSSVLLPLADAAPDTAGLSVYEARAMLGIFKDIIIPVAGNNKNQKQLSDCPGQNLVYNPSFEEITACPSTTYDLPFAKRWSKANALVASAALVHSCSTTVGTQYQAPRTGQGYAGVVSYNEGFPGWDRGYAQAYLTDTLKPNKKYCVNYYVSLIDVYSNICNNMGMYFSKDSIFSKDSLLPYKPQVKNNLNNKLDDKTGWKLISGLYIAKGGERYIIIGNFDKVEDLDTMFIPGGNSPGAQYFIDDVSVVEVTNPPCDSVRAAFNYITNNSSVKFNDSSSLSAQDFKWSFGDGNTSVAQKPRHTYTGPGTYNVRLIASNWCSADTIYKTVVIVPCYAAQAAFTYNISGNTVTFNSSTSLNATAWTWAFGNGQVSSQQNPVVTYAAPGTYTVRLIISNPCSRDTLYKTVTIPPVPPPCNNAQASFTYTISGSTVTFNSSASLNTTARAWLFGDGQSDNTQNPAHTYNAPGTYTVRLITSNSCSADTVYKTVTINPVAPPCYSAQAKFRYTISGSSASFSDTSLYATTRAWAFGDGQTSALQNPVHNYTSPGNYAVRLAVTNLCSSDTLIKNIYIAPPPPAALLFKLYPNPAKNQIETAYNFTGTLQASLQIFTTNGQLIKEVSLNTSQQKAVIDISSLSSGIYIYKALAGGIVKGYGKLAVAR